MNNISLKTTFFDRYISAAESVAVSSTTFLRNLFRKLPNSAKLRRG